MVDCDAHVLELLPWCAGLVTALALCGLAVTVTDVFEYLPAWEVALWHGRSIHFRALDIGVLLAFQ